MTESIIRLDDQGLSVRVHRQGGAIVDAWYRDCPVLRPYRGDDLNAFDVLDAGCFPLVPFAGRIEGNTIEYDGRQHSLARNTMQDRHVLHGDGWLGVWDVVQQTSTDVVLSFRHIADAASPFDYESQQSVSVRDGQLRIQLSVTQCGFEALPFGLGIHPYFPLTPDTLVKFEAGRLWDEREHHLPGTLGSIPDSLDFSIARAIPDYWIHAGFEEWTGRVTVLYPKRQLTLQLQAGPTSHCLQLFRPDTFEEGCERYVCLEPMTHTCNAHCLDGDYGLRRLGPGDSLSLSIRLVPTLA